MNLLGSIMGLVYMQSVHGRLSTYERLVNSQNFFSPHLTQEDLSRFGRNYIEFGQYTDYLFPSLGCRFIALNNGIDTMSDNGSTDVMCFLNLFNEFYSRDISKKVKATKRACAESGKFTGTYPAYGYKRDPEDKASA